MFQLVCYTQKPSVKKTQKTLKALKVLQILTELMTLLMIVSGKQYDSG